MSATGPQPYLGGRYEKVRLNLDCPEPGGIFHTDNPNQKYCCNACKKAVVNARYYARHKAEVIERVSGKKKTG